MTILKKWWFWLIVVIVLIGTFSIFSNQPKGTQRDTAKISSSKKKTTVSTILNKTLTINNDSYELTLNSYKVIPVGQAGNEYGKKPVIAFWYTVKNNKAKHLDPSSAWISSGMKAVQDNNSNQVNTLDVGLLPDNKFLDTQSQEIKQGGTAKNAVAYNLTDNNTPVNLELDSSIVSDKIIAKQQFNVK